MSGEEIEIKYRLTSGRQAEDIAASLIDLGAEDLGVVLEDNIFFDWPDGRLRVADSGLRIRLKSSLESNSDARPLVTFKGPRKPGRLKIRREVEFRCDDPEACEEMFTALGMVRRMVFQKRRRSFRLDGCLIELDELPQLGLYLEVEGPGEYEIAGIIEKLQLDSLVQEHRTYARLVDEALSDGEIELRF